MELRLVYTARKGNAMKRINEVFSERLANLLFDRNVKRNELAEQLKVRNSAVSEWVSGRSLPKIERLIQISTLLKTSVSYLIGETENTTEQRLYTEDDVVKIVEAFRADMLKSLETQENNK